MHWLMTDWHWAMIIATIITLTLFGFVVFGTDSDGDWFSW